MKVRDKIFENKRRYKAGVEYDKEENKDSIKKAIDFCREEMANRGDDFVGFHIETLRGELKHKINNGY